MTEHDHHTGPDHTGGTDSAGQPWKGRTFESHASETDDGSAPQVVLDALSRFHAADAGPETVVDALRGVRLLVPLVAHAGEEGVTDAGLRVDKTQELSLVTVSGPGGRTVLPAFTSVTAMSAWNPKARPIPVDARRAALAAASEGTELIVLDPGSPTEFALRRPAVWALAQGEPWIPAPDDPDVAEAFEVSIRSEPAVAGIRAVAGDPQARLRGPELLVVLALVPGLDKETLDQLVQRLQARWAESAVIAERVDSLGVRVTALD
ncbi:SseB family protein [Herbiconiux liukaitaii]|uniref:SseB family protein n=1 Tax=Herbiconiux liukaitaii TaxID=3342799 RepID=UPI0035B7B50D